MANVKVSVAQLRTANRVLSDAVDTLDDIRSSYSGEAVSAVRAIVLEVVPGYTVQVNVNQR